MNTAKIKQLQHAARRALDDLDACLVEEFPKGARIAVLLKHGQKNPTWGVVEAIWNGAIQFKLDSSKARRRSPYRMVQPEAVLEVIKPSPEAAGGVTTAEVLRRLER